MACTQSLTGSTLIVRQTQPQIARRRLQRPFTTVAGAERRQTACKAERNPFSQILSVSAAAALLLVSLPPVSCLSKLASLPPNEQRFSKTSGILQASPAFATPNALLELSESSSSVEQLKSKFLGPQVCGEHAAASTSKPCPRLVSAKAFNFGLVQDATSQRKLLGSFTGSNTNAGFDDQGIGRQEDATIDNPNDSPRPKDRSRQGTAQAQSKMQQCASAD